MPFQRSRDIRGQKSWPTVACAEGRGVDSSNVGQQLVARLAERRAHALRDCFLARLRDGFEVEGNFEGDQVEVLDDAEIPNKKTLLESGTLKCQGAWKPRLSCMDP